MAKMTDADMTQREKIVKSMKKNFKDFRNRYGDRAKDVMYATATKMAMKEEHYVHVRTNDNKHDDHISAGLKAHNGKSHAATDKGHIFKFDNEKNADNFKYHVNKNKSIYADHVNEEVKDSDKGEYDYEGDMAKSSLRTIIRNAEMMHDMLEDDTNLPEWVQSKITLAEDYLVSAAQYMQSEMSEQFFRPPEGFTKKGIEKGGGVKTMYHYKGKSNTPSGATMKMGGVKVNLGKTPTKRRPQEGSK